MKRTIYYMILCLLMSLGEIMAQGISGKVMDGKEQPIDGVAVILQTLDSVYVDAVVTDTLGDFRLNHPLDQSYRLIFQHILYNTIGKKITTANVGTVVLEEKDYQLAEITVKGERPQVKLEGGKLTYDIPQLMKDKTATNAFEIIKDLPGLIERNDNLELVGASRLNIILNGQLTTMSADQLIQLLKTMPASRVEKAEVMYNAPAKYNVKGALLNVVLSKNESETPSWQGETGVHKRSYREFPLYITVDEHMPPEHLYYKEVNSKDGNYYRRWASAIGPAMSELIDRLLKSSKHEEQSYSACVGILHKVKTIPKGAAEEVARKCIEINSCKYFTFKQMLKKMDVKELPEHSPGTLPNHENIRGKDYYK